MKVLLLDNYDSFTYNLFHLIDGIEGIDTDVIRNDKISAAEVSHYDRIILSPGPGLPDQAGCMKEIIKACYSSKPILGICLGMQAIAECFGGKLLNLPQVFHGVARETYIQGNDEKLFKGMQSPFLSGRYHSWGVDLQSLPSSFLVTAVDTDGHVMALKHENNLLRGVQFHPESILTQFGKTLMTNWLNEC